MKHPHGGALNHWMAGTRIVLMTAAIAALMACGTQDGASAHKAGGMRSMPPPQVKVVSVEPETIIVNKALVGRLAPYRSADVRARVAGVLQQRAYTEGTQVTRGEVLFRIDPAPLQATLAQAQAQLASARANLGNAQIQAKRAKELIPKGFISRSDADNLLAAERSARAAVQVAQAAIKSARINLDYATVRAPIAGQAGQAQVTEGALVGQGQATLLTTIDQLDPLYVHFSVSLNDLNLLRSSYGHDQKATVQVTDDRGQTYPHAGQLDFAASVVDPATNAVSLRATLPNPDGRLLPGSFVTLNAALASIDQAYLVPTLALQRDGQGAFVLVLGADGTVARRDVVANEQIEAGWVVESGMQAGDQVIVSGLQKVQVGKPAVAAKPPQPKQPPASTEAAE